MSLDNIIRLALLGAYTIYLIVYSVLTALWYKREQQNHKSKRYIQDNLLADLLESGVEIPKEQMIKCLRGEDYKPQPQPTPNKVEDKVIIEHHEQMIKPLEQPTNEIPVGTPPSVVVCENK